MIDTVTISNCIQTAFSGILTAKADLEAKAPRILKSVGKGKELLLIMQKIMSKKCYSFLMMLAGFRFITSQIFSAVTIKSSKANPKNKPITQSH